MTAGPLDIATVLDAPRQWTVGPLSGTALTANHRVHWTVRQRLTREWREAAGWATLAAGIPRLERVRVVAYWLPYDRRRRDPGNLSPVIKACVDGIVDAGVIPDDDSRHLVGPDYRIGDLIEPPTPRRRGTCTVRLAIIDLGGQV